MLDCPESGQLGTGMKKLTMPEHVRHLTMPTPSGIFIGLVPNKILMDVGMPIPALVSSMLMPSYVIK
jgi:hypothetical protein